VEPRLVAFEDRSVKPRGLVKYSFATVFSKGQHHNRGAIRYSRRGIVPGAAGDEVTEESGFSMPCGRQSSSSVLSRRLLVPQQPLAKLEQLPTVTLKPRPG
jgi:hypothetical protein